MIRPETDQSMGNCQHRAPAHSPVALAAITSRHSCKSVCLIAIVIAAFGMPVQAQTTQNIDHNSLLLPYLSLLNSPDVMAKNLQQAISINNFSTPAQRSLAIADNMFAVDNGSVVADGLGTSLDRIYQNAIKSNSPLLSADSNIVQAFRQANGLATADAALNKIYFLNGTRAVTGSVASDLRPFQAAPSQIQNFAPGILSSLVDNPAFPSGHSSFSYAQDLLFGIMVPERYGQLLTRASEYGNSRIALGAHYPLDVIAGRIIATYDIAQLLNNNPKYLNKTVGIFGGDDPVTTSSDFAALFDKATTDLRNLLQKGCGTDLATCAAAAAPDRFGDPRRNREEYVFRLTYGLPPAGPTDLPPVVPAGAEILLRTRFPYLSPAQLRDVLATTELPSGVPLDDGTGWARLNLYSAADGYGAFNDNVVVTMNADRGGFNAVDSWNNDIGGVGGLTLSGTGTLVLNGANTYSGPTVINGGTLVVNGSIASPTFVNSGGMLRGTGVINAPLVNNGVVAPGNPAGTLTVNGDFVQRRGAAFQIRLDETGAAKLRVSGTAALDGMLEIKPLNGVVPGFGQTFPILGAGQGVNGTFASVAAPELPGSLFYQPLYATHAVGIMVARPLAEFGSTPDQQRVATVLDRIRTNPDRDVQNFLGTLYPAEVTGGVSQALDRLAPENTFGTTLFGRLFADMLGKPTRRTRQRLACRSCRVFHLPAALRYCRFRNRQSARPGSPNHACRSPRVRRLRHRAAVGGPPPGRFHLRSNRVRRPHVYPGSKRRQLHRWRGDARARLSPRSDVRDRCERQLFCRRHGNRRRQHEGPRRDPGPVRNHAIGAGLP